MIYTDEQIYANRKTWIEFLKQPDTKKALGVLDRGNGERCCLGHGCFALGIPSRIAVTGIVLYDNRDRVAPGSFMDMVGLKTSGGYASEIIAGTNEHSLAAMNDQTNKTPQEIGEYLESVIMGGDGTPFREINI